MTRPVRHLVLARSRRRGRLLVPLLVVLALLAPGAPAHGAGADGVWPLDPRPEVVARFAPPASPWGAGHRGVDLRGRVGQPVRAALGGTIAFAGALAGRGVVVVRHGATRTTYEPVAALVAVGTRVGTGEVVGRLEAGGSHCAPAACLHWGWRRGSAYLDPLGLVGGGPVRLLPLAGTGPVAPSGGGVAVAAPAPARTEARVAASVGTAVSAQLARWWAPLAAAGLLPCPPQARGWACR